MASAATPSLRRVNQALPGAGGGGGGGGGNGRANPSASTRGTNATPSLVESLMRESADGIDVSARLPELKRAILTDGITADDMGMSSHRIYIWLVLLRTPVLSYDTYAALLKRGASPAYAKINDDTHRTLATDPLFARRVSQNSIARLLNTIAWALDDANKLRREAAARQGVDVAEPPKAVAANVDMTEPSDQAQIQTQAQAQVQAQATSVGEGAMDPTEATEPSAVQIAQGIAELELRADTAAAAAAGSPATEIKIASAAESSATLPSTPVPTSNGTSDPSAAIPSSNTIHSASEKTQTQTDPPPSASTTPHTLQPPPAPVPATSSLPSPSATPSSTIKQPPLHPSSTLSTPSTTSTSNPAQVQPQPQPQPQASSQPTMPPPLPAPSSTSLALPAPYVQGMNVLAAPFLYVSRSEPQAHAGLFALLASHLPSYITPTMSGVHLGLGLVDRLLTLLDPVLAAHLAARGLTASVYAFPAVLTLSACTPPLPEVLILWDFLLSWGVHLNLLAVVAQLHLLRNKLLKSDSPMKELRSSLGPLRAKKVQELVVAFVGRVPEDLWREMVAHTGGGGGRGAEDGRM